MAPQQKIDKKALLFVLGTLLSGVLIAGAMAWLVLTLHRLMMVHPSEIKPGSGYTSLTTAWFKLGEKPNTSTLDSLKIVTLPDDWSKNHPDLGGSAWYRIHFDAPVKTVGNQLKALYIDKACTQLKVYLNGELLYQIDNTAQSISEQCYQSHIIPLPSLSLRPQKNQLDINLQAPLLKSIVEKRRSAQLGKVWVGDWNKLYSWHEKHTYWTNTFIKMIGSIMIVVGIFTVYLAILRRLSFLLYFGLLILFWGALNSRLFLPFEFLPTNVSEIMAASAFSIVNLFVLGFLYNYAVFINAQAKKIKFEQFFEFLSIAQIILMPLTLWLSNGEYFATALIWFLVFSVEIVIVNIYFLWFVFLSNRVEFLISSGTLGALIAFIGLELGFQYGMIDNWGLESNYLIIPAMFALISLRLNHLYFIELESVQGNHRKLKKRVNEINDTIQSNFSQIALLRSDKIAEKERKRIAADLHDDLGAKLLTIVHTSENVRIATLAREALDEMRLSVRGITGRPIRLPDALADWRAEMVMRLGQAGIEVDWHHQKDIVDVPLSARIFVQTTRIIREAISNVIKHSKAAHVLVRSEAHAKTFHITIQDNGIGITLGNDARLDAGQGVTNMKYRAKQLNGQCLIESGIGYGTVIRLSLPLELETAPG